MSSLIAVPSENPGGLDAPVEAHFGHCAVYTLVRVEEGRMFNVHTIANMPHQQGGCMTPVHLLARQGVTQMIAGGMGMGPLTGFNRNGIQVYFGNGVRTVGEAVQAMLDGKLQLFGKENTCQGGCGGH